jgi:hypothetical protein
MFKSMKIKLTHAVAGRTWALHDIVIPMLKNKGNDSSR